MKLISLIVGLCFSCSIYGQDTIVYKTGSKIPVKILEVNVPDNVKYKEYHNQSGPTYTENLYNIKFIRYENGLVDEFNISDKTENRNTIIVTDTVIIEKEIYPDPPEPKEKKRIKNYFGFFGGIVYPGGSFSSDYK